MICSIIRGEVGIVIRARVYCAEGLGSRHAPPRLPSPSVCPPSCKRVPGEAGEGRVKFFLVSYVEERPWWPIKCPNKGRKKRVES